MKAKYRSTAKFEYCELDNAILVYCKKDKLDDYLSSSEVQTISQNTSNTWQTDREQGEIVSNTVQGKVVEDMFDDYINHLQKESTITYVSYDNFRKDNYRKHAPIDGLLFQEGNSYIEAAKEGITKDVFTSEFGKLSPTTRTALREWSIFTVEIKSSQIPNHVYSSLSNFNKLSTQERLINELRKLDFFVYPTYTRNKGSRIHNFEEYVNYIESEQIYAKGWAREKLVAHLLEVERNNSANICTRIFVDYLSTDSFIGYFLGYALGRDFFDNPTIMNMPGKKSGNAVYFSHKIAPCASMGELLTDKRLW
jgi:hypothetical protein